MNKHSTTTRRARQEELEQCLRIRHTVFIVEQNVPLDIEVDGLDPTALHFLTTIDAVGIATARMRVIDEQTVKAERVAVLKEYRGRGIGRDLMSAIEREASRTGKKHVLLSAQLDALPFYIGLGYVPEGDIYLDADIEHRTMRKQV